ncbi:MAG: hypothetical protein IKC26_11620 [Clostridia bacterium]|nr:hypothetical protein [Clostridia bacterium]MBR2908676.1 hypothetical protein [Clostridia bacterium]
MLTNGAMDLAASSGASRLEDGERESRLAEGRIDDLSARADGGEIAFSGFLTPREQRFFEKHLARRGRSAMVRFYGGFIGAERRVACFLPDYLSDLLEGHEEGSEEERLYLGESLDEAIVMLEIRGSGYRTLTHRDVLGAVLGLGIERDAIGDILLLDGDGSGREQPRIYLMTVARLAPFLLSELKKIGSDTVRVKRGHFPDGFVFEPKVRQISDTVASNRLDCVIGAITNTSREKAQSLIRGGLVEVDYEPAARPDARLLPPNVITVRGHGKFRLLALGEVTKKGRLRLRAEQYL